MDNMMLMKLLIWVGQSGSGVAIMKKKVENIPTYYPKTVEHMKFGDWQNYKERKKLMQTDLHLQRREWEKRGEKVSGKLDFSHKNTALKRKN